jgi:hypothetical protein
MAQRQSHRAPFLAVAVSAFTIVAPGCWADTTAGGCAAFVAAGVPFYTCIRGGVGGFLLSAGGQASVVALLRDGDDGPQFILSMDYEAGDPVGTWAVSNDFDLILRWDRDGPEAGKLTAEFCGPFPVPVAVAGGDTALRTCGARMPIFEDLRWLPPGEPMARR